MPAAASGALRFQACTAKAQLPRFPCLGLKGSPCAPSDMLSISDLKLRSLIHLTADFSASSVMHPISSSVGTYPFLADAVSE